MTLKIVLTDCDTVNSNDLDLSVFEQLGEVIYYGETPAELIPERIKDADVVVCNKTVIGKKEIDAAKNLKLITLFATGYNNIDVAYAREKGIDVCNAGVYSTNAVAQQVFAFILNNASKVAEYDRDIKDGAWIRSRLFSVFSRPTSELADKTLGIFGYGAIGKKVAKLGNAFDMNVIVCTRTPQIDESVRFVSFDELLSCSDYLSVNCPLTPQTKELFDKAAFAKMKDGAYFINTARGSIVDEAALAKELATGRFKAVLDVYEQEPLPMESPLRGLENVLLIPHMGGPTTDRYPYIAKALADDIPRVLAGEESSLAITVDMMRRMTR